MTTTGKGLAALLALLPLWPTLGGTVVDVRPGCGALVQAQNPQTGQGDLEGYALLLDTSDAYGDSLAVGQHVLLDVGAGLVPDEARPIEVVRDGLGLATTGLGWLDADQASSALGARCGGTDAQQ
jgi:hypothetical protein